MAYHYEPLIARHHVTSSHEQAWKYKIMQTKNMNNPSGCKIIADYSELYYSILTGIILAALITMSYFNTLVAAIAAHTRIVRTLVNCTFRLVINTIMGRIRTVAVCWANYSQLTHQI